MSNHDLLNQIYMPLYRKQRSLHGALAHRGYPVTSGFFNGHYRRTDAGYHMEVFPIPVVSVTGLCDIEIGLDEITVSTKLPREAALSYDYDKLAARPFEAFGVVEYLNDFYLPGDSFDTFRSRMLDSHEAEIGFSFQFSMNEEGIPEFVALLKAEGFHY